MTNCHVKRHAQTKTLDAFRCILWWWFPYGVFSSSIILTLFLLKTPKIHLGHIFSKKSHLLLFSFVRLKIMHPYVTIGEMRALYNLIFKCLHIALSQIFCFNLPKSCTANEIQYSISVWMFGTILARYLNVYTCSIGRPSTLTLPISW